MVCEKCEKKLGTVITPDTWKDGARNTTGSIHMERTSSPPAEFVKVQFTSLALITARAVHTRRASVQCVEKRFWIPKTTSKHPSSIERICVLFCIYILAFCITFCLKMLRMTEMLQLQNNMLYDNYIFSGYLTGLFIHLL